MCPSAYINIMRGREDPWQQDPVYTTEIIGIREHTMLKEVAAFAIAEIVRPAPLPKLLAILTNHQAIYLFNSDFWSPHQSPGSEWSINECCRLKLDLRMSYKFQSFLFLKPTYSTNFECLFLILQGGEIAVFNEEIYLLGVVKLQCCDPANKLKHSIDYEYLEKENWRQVRKVKRGLFLLLFADTIEWHEVEIQTNHKLSKFKPSYKFTLTQTHKKIIETKLSHPVGLQVYNYKTKLETASEKVNDFIYLVCNCSTDVFFYLINKDSMDLEGSICLQGVGEGPSGVNSVAVGVANQRAILGMCTGAVKVYSLKQQNRGKILFSIEVSQSPIQKMLWLKQKQFLIAYSQDCYLSEINFNTMSVQQRYRAGSYTALAFINEKTIVGLGWKASNSYNMQESTQDQFNKQLIFGQLSLNYHKIVELNSTIVGAFHQDSSHLVQLQDNSLVRLGQGQSAIQVVRTYLPPNCISVQSISKNIYEGNKQQYWLLTDKSEVYKYHFNQSGAQVAGVLQFSRFKDKHQTDHKFKINCLIFANKTVPLSYDSEITEKQYLSNKSAHGELQPVFMTTNSGDLLVVPLKQPTSIIFRLKKTQAPLLYIHELTAYFDRDSSRSVVVFGSANQCFFVQITSSKLPVELFRLELSWQRIKIINSSILAVTSGSNFNAYYFKQEFGHTQLQCFRQEHYSPGLIGDPNLSCLSYINQKEGKYITTGYTIGQIIIWQVTANVLDQGFLQVRPLYLIQNSNEHLIQYAFYSNKSVCFNLGRYFVKKHLQQPIEDQGTIENRNFRIGKGKKLIDEESSPLMKPKREMIREKKEQRVKGGFTIIKSKGKRRSESLGLLKDKKWEEIFHFPDSQLYRSIINKSLIH